MSGLGIETLWRQLRVYTCSLPEELLRKQLCQQALLAAVTQQQNRGREYGLRRSAYLASRGACAPREPFLVIELILRPFANVNKPG